MVILNGNTSLDVPYYGLDNNDYVNGLGFCCNSSEGTTSGGSSTGKMTAKNDNAELQQFYYHPDHLGSSSYISNLDGEVVQHVEYVPFGEVFLEEKNAKWNTPYLFTSKELDRETGLYYFGARYQDPKLGIFISVDPLAEKYKGWSSYAYVLNNPVRFIDPTGMEADDIIIRGKNTQTGKMQPAIVVKTTLVNTIVDVESLPVIPTQDPRTNKDTTTPIVVNGVDELIKSQSSVFGNADAVSVTIGGGIVAGGGISGSMQIAAFITGKDAGGAFLYMPENPSPAIGISVGGGIEVGGIFAAASTAKNFDRFTLTGNSVELAGGYGTISGTLNMGIASKLDWTPTSYGVSTSIYGASAFKEGASLSMSTMKLQSVLVQPPKK
jgi:RHS repeat-associated protein